MGHISDKPQFLPSHLKIAKVYQVNQDSKGEYKEVGDYSLTNSAENFQILQKILSRSDME